MEFCEPLERGRRVFRGLLPEDGADPRPEEVLAVGQRHDPAQLGQGGGLENEVDRPPFLKRPVLLAFIPIQSAQSVSGTVRGLAADIDEEPVDPLLLVPVLSQHGIEVVRAATPCSRYEIPVNLAEDKGLGRLVEDLRPPRAPGKHSLDLVQRIHEVRQAAPLKVIESGQIDHDLSARPAHPVLKAVGDEVVLGHLVVEEFFEEIEGCRQPVPQIEGPAQVLIKESPREPGQEGVIGVPPDEEPLHENPHLVLVAKLHEAVEDLLNVLFGKAGKLGQDVPGGRLSPGYGGRHINDLDGIGRPRIGSCGGAASSLIADLAGGLKSIRGLEPREPRYGEEDASAEGDHPLVRAFPEIVFVGDPGEAAFRADLNLAAPALPRPPFLVAGRPQEIEPLGCRRPKPVQRGTAVRSSAEGVEEIPLFRSDRATNAGAGHELPGREVQGGQADAPFFEAAEGFLHERPKDLRSLPLLEARIEIGGVFEDVIISVLVEPGQGLAQDLALPGVEAQGLQGLPDGFLAFLVGMALRKPSFVPRAIASSPMTMTWADRERTT